MEDNKGLSLGALVGADWETGRAIESPRVRLKLSVEPGNLFHGYIGVMTASRRQSQDGIKESCHVVLLLHGVSDAETISIAVGT